MSNKKSESLQRVLEIAATTFLNHSYEAVSVTEIARRARCSKATVYDAFSNKEGLFEASLWHAITPPPLEWHDGDPGLPALVHYMHHLLWQLGSVKVCSLMRTVIRQPVLTAKVFQRADRQAREQRDRTLLRMIEAAQAQGMLRPLQSTTLWSHLRAATNERVLMNLLYQPASLDEAEGLLEDLFLPLVTPQGATTLRKCLATIESESCTPVSLP